MRAKAVSTPATGRFAPYVPEFCFLSCDGWAAVTLPSGPIAGRPDHSPLLAWVGGAGAMLIAAGLLLLLLPGMSRCRLSAVSRACGLGFTGMLWVCLGGSGLTVTPDALDPLPCLMMGCLAWGLVLRRPPQPARP